MKKCQRCKLVFHSDARQRCLYCNSLLMTTSKDDSMAFDDNRGMESFQTDQPVLKQVLEERSLGTPGRIMFIFSSYFRSRTFDFMYSFSRQQFLRGKTFNRLLVMPLNLSSFLMLPWVAFNIFDSLSIRSTYNGYCEKCGSKFRQFTQNQVHNHEECFYNREYHAIVDDIISGRILTSEEEFKRQSVTRLSAGKQCAYQDLCSGKDFFSGMLDITCVWFSVCLIILVLVLIFFPVFFVAVHKLLSYNVGLGR